MRPTLRASESPDRRPVGWRGSSDAQIRLLERRSSDFRNGHVEASRPGELLNQATFYWATPKSVGKVYLQVVVDVSCSFAFAKVYTSKMPITACDLIKPSGAKQP